MNKTSLSSLKRYQGFVLPLALALIAIATALLGIKPAIFKVIELYENIKTTRAEIVALTDKENFLESLDEKQMRLQLSSLVSAVPLTKSPETAIMTLEGIASQNSLTMGDLSLSVAGLVASGSAESASKAQMPKFAIAFKSYGTTEQLMNFLSLLYRARRLLQVQEFELSFDTTPPELSGSLNAFYLPLLRETRSLSAPLIALTPGELDLITKISNLSLFIREVQAAPISGEPRPDPFNSIISQTQTASSPPVDQNPESPAPLPPSN